MIKRFLNTFILIFLLFLSTITVKYYLSEKNIIHINKSRSTYSLENKDSLPVLKDDTNNIIVYKNDLEEFKKKRKKRLWENLLSND